MPTTGRPNTSKKRSNTGRCPFFSHSPNLKVSSMHFRMSVGLDSLRNNLFDAPTCESSYNQIKRPDGSTLKCRYTTLTSTSTMSRSDAEHFNTLMLNEIEDDPTTDAVVLSVMKTPKKTLKKKAKDVLKTTKEVITSMTPLKSKEPRKASPTKMARLYRRTTTREVFFSLSRPVPCSPVTPATEYGPSGSQAIQRPLSPNRRHLTAALGQEVKRAVNNSLLTPQGFREAFAGLDTKIFAFAAIFMSCIFAFAAIFMSTTLWQASVAMALAVVILFYGNERCVSEVVAVGRWVQRCATGNNGVGLFNCHPQY